MSTPAVLLRAYAWVRPPVLVERDPTTVHIGTGLAERMLLRDAPPDAASVLRELDGRRPVAEILAGRDSYAADSCAADPSAADADRFDADWIDVLAVLERAGLVRPCAATPADAVAQPGAAAPADAIVRPAVPAADAAQLTQRFGRDRARRIAIARRDALVVVHGTPPLADAVEDILAASGVGRVHLVGDRQAAMPAPAHRSARPPARAASTAGSAAASRPADAREPHRSRPAAQQLPALAVLAGPAADDLALAATLTLARVPHVAVTAAADRAVIGPLVLPGRSSCMWCLHRHRVDADADWPAVHRAASRNAPPASTVVRSIAVSLAAHQVLAALDGLVVPESVDGTLEWTADGVTTRRRSWTPHAECVCGAAAPA